MKITFILNIIILAILSSTFFIVTAASNEKNGDYLNPRLSERVILMNYLQDKGIKNSFVAHYIINNRTLSVNDMKTQLNNIAGYDFTRKQLEEWVKNINDYKSGKIKKYRFTRMRLNL